MHEPGVLILSETDIQNTACLTLEKLVPKDFLFSQLIDTQRTVENSLKDFLGTAQARQPLLIICCGNTSGSGWRYAKGNGHYPYKRFAKILQQHDYHTILVVNAVTNGDSLWQHLEPITPAHVGLIAPSGHATGTDLLRRLIAYWSRGQTLPDSGNQVSFHGAELQQLFLR